MFPPRFKYHNKLWKFEQAASAVQQLRHFHSIEASPSQTTTGATGGYEDIVVFVLFCGFVNISMQMEVLVPWCDMKKSRRFLKTSLLFHARVGKSV